MKACTRCLKQTEEIDMGSKTWCKTCIKEYNKNYRLNNKEKFKQYKQTKEYKAKDKQYKQSSKYKKWEKEYYQLNKDKINQYYIDNKEKIIKRTRVYEARRMKNDLQYKLKKNISAYLRSTLKSKDKESVLKYLPYTMEELKKHIENQFEPWMSWTNWGVYNSQTWNDNDSATWKWNIDHIIPHSLFNYSSIQDDNFKKCWALENLRPYSAKQNLLDGSNRSRHK